MENKEIREKIINLYNRLNIKPSNLISNDNYNFIYYLQDVFNSKYSGIRKRHEAKEMLLYIAQDKEMQKAIREYKEIK